MKKQSWGIALVFLCLSLALSGCSIGSRRFGYDDWGSFTPDKTYSYDGKYYATQKVEQGIIQVSIYDSDDDQLVYTFEPARAWDFWGICWESATYNMWIQSGDIGVFCYRYDDMQWILDINAQQPEDIISKYDD